MRSFVIFASVLIATLGCSPAETEPTGAGGGSTSSASSSSSGDASSTSTGLPCSVECVIANAATTCNGDQCEFVSCLPGYSDCDAKIANGCEAHPADDLNNCGICGLICKSSQGQTPHCSDNECQPLVCDEGHSDCNKDPADGCEIEGAC
jgi:hypothetical protein